MTAEAPDARTRPAVDEQSPSDVRQRQAACPHADFAACVNVHRLEDIGRFVAEVQIRCAQCGLEFNFLRLPHAITVERPAVNIDATTVSLPIEPGRKPIPRSGRVPVEVPRRSES